MLRVSSSCGNLKYFSPESWIHSKFHPIYKYWLDSKAYTYTFLFYKQIKICFDLKKQRYCDIESSTINEFKQIFWSEVKYICDIYDWDGKGEIDLFFLGDVMYALGMNTTKKVSNSAKTSMTVSNQQK